MQFGLDQFNPETIQGRLMLSYNQWVIYGLQPPLNISNKAQDCSVHWSNRWCDQGAAVSTYPNETDHTSVGFVSANGQELHRQPQIRHWACPEECLTVLTDSAGIRLIKRVFRYRFFGNLSFCYNISFSLHASTIATKLRLGPNAGYAFHPGSLTTLLFHRLSLIFWS